MEPTKDLEMRRAFLKSALAASTAAAALPLSVAAAISDNDPSRADKNAPKLPKVDAERPLESTDAAHADISNPGSDFMVEVMQAASIKYVAAMPGSTFRGLHESIVNYGQNKHPELISCMHEEASVGIAHGYAKVSGLPMACLVHSTVGLQHASMALFNAWCDRVPMLTIAGNIVDETKRRPGIEWYHSAQDLGAMVRDFVKWDDAPASLQHFSESFARAKSFAMTPPMGPVLIIADADLQEEPIRDAAKLLVPKAVEVAPPTVSARRIDVIADQLLAARSPLIVADRAVRSQAGMRALIDLAESLGAPVVDQLSRMNFPTSHYLNHSSFQRELVRKADVILALEVGDLWGTLNSKRDVPGKPESQLYKPDVQVISLSTEYLFMKSNMQDFERYFPASMAIGADAEETLPALAEAVRRRANGPQKAAARARKAQLKMAFDLEYARSRELAAAGWDDEPVSTARLSIEIWDKIRHEKWALVSDTIFISRWPQRLWDFTETYQYIGGAGGGGVGYGAPAAVGAALAHKDAGRISVNIQTDGDLMVMPCALWTAAHHQLPLLTVMHNNRAWHQETMHIQRMAGQRNRGVTNAGIGTVIKEPFVDYASLARSMGVWAEGPIYDPRLLAPALSRALAIVKMGQPALIDVVTQPR